MLVAVSVIISAITTIKKIIICKTFVFFLNRVSCSPDLPSTYYVVENVLELLIFLALLLKYWLGL